MDNIQIFQNNEVVQFDDGISVRVIDLLGSGGQAEVYKIELNGKEYALKMYHEENCNEHFKDNLINIIKNKVEDSRFIWPLHFVSKGIRFGYIMNLIPNGFYEIREWVDDKIDMNYEDLIIACINLVDAIHELHAGGYSYKDISLSNICVNPNSGDILVIDNDNVTTNRESAGISGTPKFIAPEIVSGYTKNPSRLTDLHSVAVLLFYMTMVEHPLEGNFQGKKEIDFEDENGLDNFIYGRDTARFIFNDQNDLDRNLDPNIESHETAKILWMRLTNEIRELFTRAFVDGIKDPQARPNCDEWTNAFLRLLATKYECSNPDCNTKYYYDKNIFKANNGTPICPNCQSRIIKPQIKINKAEYIILEDGKKLYAGQFYVTNQSKLKVIFEVEYNNNRVRFLNKCDLNIMCNNKRLPYGVYSEYLNNDGNDTITINGMEYKIAVPS